MDFNIFERYSASFLIAVLCLPVPLAIIVQKNVIWLQIVVNEATFVNKLHDVEEGQAQRVDA